MELIKPENYISHRKLICDWTDNKKYYIPFKMLKFHVSESISFKQSKWLKKNLASNTQKRNKAKKKL